MNLQISKEKISSSEVVFSDTNEQSVELDYTLPDYYPEIFKICKCITQPQIICCDISGDKLNYELALCIRIVYCAENSSAVHVIEQKMNYSKKLDIGRVCVNPELLVRPQVNYMNCRAVNSRRIDIRGAISTAVEVSDIISSEIITEVSGGNIQLKKTAFSYPSNQITVSKRITVSDEFDLGLSKPAIIDIIRSDAIIASTDKKIIANKLIVKGEIYVNMLYTCIKEDNDSVESMQFTLPFSQIVDMEGIDDRFECITDSEIVSCEIIPRSDGDGNSKIAECNVNIAVKCCAYRVSTSELAVDEYSTSFKTYSEKHTMKLEAVPQVVNSVCVVKNALVSQDEEIDCIFDAWCTLKNSVARTDNENNININGTADYIVFARNKSGAPIFLDKEDNFTVTIPVGNLTQDSQVEINLTPISCSYNLASDNSVEVKSEIKVSGCVRNVMNIEGIRDISVDEDEPVHKNNNYALKIYYTEENEDLWDIAKKYGTSVSAIIEENEIENDTISGSKMILIPIV